MGLNKEQAEAVNHVYGPMLVLAGPGSGKTFTLVERVRHLIEEVGIPPSEILVITFSKKAALEMQARFNRLVGENNYPVSFGTFHAIFYHILKQNYSYSKDSILTPKMKTEYMERVIRKLDYSEEDNEAFIGDLLSKISLYKTMSGDKEKKINNMNMPKEDIEKFIKIYEEYDILTRNNRKIDFDDMLYDCFNLLRTNENILMEWQKRYKYFLVDEFQDINDVQYDVLTMLAGKDRNVFAVGDDDQSIYGFRGSKPSLMKRFLRESDGIITVNLCKNYRCPQCVIDAAERLILNNCDRIEKHQISRKNDRTEGSVRIEVFPSIVEEADFIINELIDRREKEGKIVSTAVLYRSSQSVSYLCERLLETGIPFKTDSRKASFYDAEWAIDIITYLKLAIYFPFANRKDLFRIINRPDRKVSRDAFIDDDIDLKNIYFPASYENQMWKKFVNDLQNIRDMTPFAAVSYILRVIGYESYMKERQTKKGYSLETINRFKEEILFRAKSFVSIKEWISSIEYIRENDKKIPDETYSQGFVLLQTAHASKGLEYDNVYILGLQEGIFPHNKANSEESILEERRLLYVAMTRARKELVIIGRGDNEHGKRVSRFISELKTL